MLKAFCNLGSFLLAFTPAMCPVRYIWKQLRLPQNKFPKLLKQEKAVLLHLNYYFTPQLLLCSEFETFFLRERTMHKIPSRVTVQTQFGAVVINEATNHLTALCFYTDRSCAEIQVNRYTLHYNIILMQQMHLQYYSDEISGHTSVM